MEYTEEIIARVEELAEALTPIQEISDLLGLNGDVLRMDISSDHSEVSIAYRRGKARTALKLRRNELDLAEAGSPMAIQYAHEYLIKMQDGEKL